MTTYTKDESSRPARLLSVDGLAAYLDISRSSVYRLVRRGDIRAVHVGNRFRFHPADVEEYLERNVVA